MEEWQREVGTTSFGRHVDRAIFQERSWNLGPNKYRYHGGPRGSVTNMAGNRTLTSPIHFWSQQIQKTGGRKTSSQNEEKKTENVLRCRLINANRVRSTLSHHWCEIYESMWGQKRGPQLKDDGSELTERQIGYSESDFDRNDFTVASRWRSEVERS
jgi:hypothetical protein